MISVKSKRDGRLAQTDGKIEDGFITILEADGRKINIAESTFKRYWSKVDTNQKSNIKESPKESPKVEVKKQIKKQPKVEKKNEVKEPTAKVEKKNQSRITVKTSKLPLRSLYHSIRTSNYKWFFSKFNSFNDNQKKEVINYMMKEGTEKHKKFLLKNNLIKGDNNESK